MNDESALDEIVALVLQHRPERVRMSRHTFDYLCSTDMAVQKARFASSQSIPHTLAGRVLEFDDHLPTGHIAMLFEIPGLVETKGEDS